MSKEQNFFIAGAGDMALGAWGLQKVINPYSLFHSLFTFDVPFKKWNSIVNGTEENLLTSTLVTSVDGFLSVKTAASNGDVTYVHSRRHPQYQSNRGHHYTLDDLSIENPSLPAAYRVTSLGDAGELKSGCVDITSEGGNEKHEQYASASAIGKSASGTDIPILAIYSPPEINGKMNTRDNRLARVSGASDKRAVFKIWQTRNPAALTGASFNPVGSGTYMEFDTAATAFNTSLADLVTAFRVEANDYQALDNPAREIIDFFMIHGDYLVITASVSTGTCDAVAEWGEEV